MYFIFYTEVVTELYNSEDPWLVGIIMLQLWRICIVAVRNWPTVDSDYCWRNIYLSSPYTSHHRDRHKINYGRQNARVWSWGARLPPRNGGRDSFVRFCMSMRFGEQGGGYYWKDGILRIHKEVIGVLSDISLRHVQNGKFLVVGSYVLLSLVVSSR
jgi:hypothetical protein